LDDVESDLGELELKEKRQKINNRKQWASVIKEVRVFRCPWSSAVRQ
jgi:hypothetical protein